MLRQTPSRRAIISPLLLLAIAAATPVAAQQTMDEARLLKTGQFLWDEAGITATGTVSMTVSIPEQRIHVYRDGQLIGMSTVSTGTKSHSTPTGEFTILQKNMWHRSNLYSNAPMPYMQRLTWTGIAIHAGHLPGYPASHGCIRLPTAFAKRLFGITTLGVAVTIIGANHRPLVKLQFADIEWLAADDMVMAAVTHQPTSASPGGEMTPESNLIDEQVLPARTSIDGPHWVNNREIEAVRSGRRTPRLEFELLPQ